MLTPPPDAPRLVCVCLPADDEGFRLIVEAAVDAARPGAHIARDGLDGVVEILRQAYPDAAVQPVVLAEPETGTAKQIWWYVHRDGRPQPVM